MDQYLHERLDSEKWGRKIRALRKERSWSQRDLAERLGIHHTTVSEIERGRTQLTLERLNRVVEALGYRGTVALEGLKKRPAPSGEGSGPKSPNCAAGFGRRVNLPRLSPVNCTKSTT